MQRRAEGGGVGLTGGGTGIGGSACFMWNIERTNVSVKENNWRRDGAHPWAVQLRDPLSSNYAGKLST
jgi:hypothetical protein